jgi:hypothetical protein
VRCNPTHRSAAILALVLSGALGLAACGTTEKSGAVGETLTAKGLEVTVKQVDTEVPVPKSDITGLSTPSAGMSLVGVEAEVCSDDHGGAIGSYSFSLEGTDGAEGELKFPSQNYPTPFDTVRDGCGTGWIVFELPETSEPSEVRFGFEDTGNAMDESENVDAKFTWSA